MMIFSGGGGGGHFYLPREAASGTRVSNFGRCSHPLSISFFEFLPSHSLALLRRRSLPKRYKNTTQNQKPKPPESQVQRTTNNQHKTQGTSSFFFFRFLLLSEPRGARIIGAHQKLARNNSTTRAKNKKAKKPITFQICF